MSQAARQRFLVLLVCLQLGCLQLGCGRRETDTKKGAIPKSESYIIKIRPDSQHATNDIPRIVSTDPVEVLKGWKVEYLAKTGSVDNPDDVKWYINNEEIGTKSPFARNETSVGKFEVELRAKKNGQNVSFKRSIAVGEVSSTESEFALEAGGSYKNDTTYKFWAKPPELNEALYMKGKVKLTAQSPALSKIQWGFVQSAKWDTNLVLLPPDEVAGKPKYLYQQSVPAGTNDAPKGRQLHGEPERFPPVPLGDAATWYDTPSTNPTKQTHGLTYSIQTNNYFDAELNGMKLTPSLRRVEPFS